MKDAGSSRASTSSSQLPRVSSAPSGMSIVPLTRERLTFWPSTPYSMQVSSALTSRTPSAKLLLLFFCRSSFTQPVRRCYCLQTRPFPKQPLQCYLIGSSLGVQDSVIAAGLWLSADCRLCRSCSSCQRRGRSLCVECCRGCKPPLLQDGLHRGPPSSAFSAASGL